MDRINDVRLNQTYLSGAGPAAPKKEAEATNQPPADKVDLGGKSEDGAIKPHKKWLVLNFIAADCNLTQFQVGNVDQMEMIGSDANTHIAAIIDVGPKPAPIGFGKKGPGEEGESQTPPTDPNTISWSGCRTLYVTKDDKMGQLNSEVIADHGQHVDMSSGDTMFKLISDAVKKFPADHIAVIFNDHGGGWTGAMSDETDGKFGKLPEIDAALKKVKAETGKDIDIIGYDACLMASTEVAYEHRNTAKILLASEESEGGAGWTYNSMLGGRTMGEALNRVQSNLYKVDVTPREFAKIIVDVNAEHNNDIPTFSATDLTKMDQLKDAVDGLADAVIKTSDKDTVKQAIANAENYGGGWDPYRDMRDLHQLSTNIIDTTKDDNLKKAAQETVKAFEEAVFANEVNPQQHPNSKGLHIFAPTTSSLGPDYKELAFAKDSKWDEAVESLGVKFDPTKKGPKVWPDGSPRKS
ncbi:MAG: clostripain-related cysteine peptidase [Firmicutes bacterium]|nr:clostripain-related cysteine peptidase [Bacillota bacterium]